MEMNKMIGSCGLACVVCSDKLKGNCEGCTETKAEHCSIKGCCMDMGVAGCYQCDKFPCDKDMFKHKRVAAFIKCAQEIGVEGLTVCLQRNHEAGIRYHKEDGSKGDYDVLDSEAEIIALVKQGR